MDIYTIQDLIEKREEIKQRILNGQIFIYPTDTVYGIGCDATNKTATNKLRAIKKINDRSVSVIAPSIEWIKKNTILKHEEYLDKLPGPYTFILGSKFKFQDNINPLNNTIGIRIPNHPVSDIATELRIPLVTTSANITQTPTIRSLDELEQNLKEQVGFAINEGIISNPPSEIYDLTNEKILRIR